MKAKYILNNLLTANLSVTQSSEDDRRIFFINISLFLLIVVSLFFLFFNFFISYFLNMFILHFINIVITFSIAYYLRKSANVFAASLMLLSLTFILIFSAIEVTHANDYILIWVFFFPLASFFLLGTHKGLKFTLFYTAVLIVYLFMISPEYTSITSKSNIVISLFFFIAILYYYEHGRENLFKTLDLTLIRLQGQKKLLKEISSTDKLTQLFNRSKLDEIFSEELSNANAAHTPLSIILIDIDHFKKVNDTHGHQIGDQILIEFSNLLKSNIRITDFVGRWGGEEFMAILRGTSLNEATAIAEALRRVVEKHTFTAVKELYASFGIATYRHDAFNENEYSMLKRADECLYTVKRNGRNGVLSESNLKQI